MLPLHVQLENSTLRGVVKRLHFALQVMLVCVRWYAAYALSPRQLEEMMAERGVFVDHATVHRWALKVLPMLGFKTFESARRLIAGIETMHMIRKGQLRCHQGLVVSDADRFYSLATR